MNFRLEACPDALFLLALTLTSRVCPGTRHLYTRLLDRTKHVKVWISFAQFEAEVRSKRLRCLYVVSCVWSSSGSWATQVKALDRARRVFEEADAHFKAEESKEERFLVSLACAEFFLRSRGPIADAVYCTGCEDMVGVRARVRGPGFPGQGAGHDAGANDREA